MSIQLNKKLVRFNNAVSNVVFTLCDGTEILQENGLVRFYEFLTHTKAVAKSVYVIGNGGSAAVASHAVVDFLNVGKIKSHTLHDPAVLSCMANDYGYENVFSQQIEILLFSGDLLIVISSSGQSKNIYNAAEVAKRKGCKVITLSGFLGDNPLRHVGDLNCWVDSTDYGVVEIAHQFILHSISDSFCSVD